MSTEAAPDILRTIAELDAGALEADLRAAAGDVAKAVRDIDSKKTQGKLNLTLTFTRAKGSGQLVIAHKMSYQKPTETGKLSEESGGETAVYVNSRGNCTILPEAQMGFDFTPARNTESV